MKRVLVMLSFLLFTAIAVNAQKNIFAKMPPKQRDSILIDTAKKALLRYAPDYYREYKIPKVILYGAVPNDYRIKKDRGRLFYQVTFFYDSQREKYPTDYIAKVNIWADNGKASDIKFMNGWGLDIEKIENDKNPTVMPFFVPRAVKGTPLPIDSTKRTKMTTSKKYDFPK